MGEENIAAVELYDTMVGESAMMWYSLPNACEDGCPGIDPAVDELAPGSSAAWAPGPSVPVMRVHLTGP